MNNKLAGQFQIGQLLNVFSFRRPQLSLTAAGNAEDSLCEMLQVKMSPDEPAYRHPEHILSKAVVKRVLQTNLISERCHCMIATENSADTAANHKPTGDPAGVREWTRLKRFCYHILISCQTNSLDVKCLLMTWFAHRS